MIYLTEFDLREQFKESPFNQFVVKKDVKLTPGARQFLIDKRVKIISETVNNINKPKNYTKDMENNDLSVMKSFESNVVYENFHMLISKIIFYIFLINKNNEDLAKNSYEIVKVLNDFCDKEENYKIDNELIEVGISLPDLKKHTKHLLNDSFEKLIKSNKTEGLNLIYLICIEIKKFFETNEKNLDKYQKYIIISIFNNLKSFID